MVKRVGRDTAVRIDKRTATGIGCLVTIGIVLALMIVTFHAIARGDVPENPLTPVGVVLELVCAILTTSTYASVVFGSHSRRRFRSYFLWMLAINTIGLLSDVIYWGSGLIFFLPFRGFARPAILSATPRHFHCSFFTAPISSVTSMKTRRNCSDIPF